MLKVIKISLVSLFALVVTQNASAADLNDVVKLGIYRAALVKNGFSPEQLKIKFDFTSARQYASPLVRGVFTALDSTLNGVSTSSGLDSVQFLSGGRQYKCLSRLNGRNLEGQNAYYEVTVLFCTISHPQHNLISTRITPEDVL